MSLFGIKLNGSKTDITEYLKKDDPKTFEMFFGKKTKIVHIENFSKEFKEKLKVLDFFEEFLAIQSIYIKDTEDLNIAIEESKEESSKIKELLEEKNKVIENFSKKAKEHEEKALEYLPYTEAENKLDDDTKIKKWSERFNKKVDSDYIKLISMIVDDKSIVSIKDGLKKIEDAYDNGEINGTISPRSMFYLIRNAKNKVEEEMGK